MTDAAPLLPILAAPPRRDRQIVATAAASVLLHLLLLAWILLPRMPLHEPADPPAITVELVRPSEISVEPPMSSEPPSSLPPVSSEAAASSAEPSSTVEPSSAEPSSAAASSEASASSAASEPPSSAAAPPVVIPVGEASSEAASASEESSVSVPASSAEASSAASEAGSSVLATNSPDAEGGADDAAVPAADLPPPPGGALHAARRFYLEAMLNAPALAKARKALKTLPPDKRLAQTCNIEAIAQLGNAGRGYDPDALVASAFAPPRIAGTTYSVVNGAFRSKQKWVGVAYTCTLSKDMSAVTAFSFHLGADVTAAMEARFGDGRPRD